MNAVERVKAICKERKIAISKLENELGFGNGYINQLRKGTFPNDRLYMIAEYLKVTPDYLNGKTNDPEGYGDAFVIDKESFREDMRTSYAFRVLSDTTNGAEESDLLEAAALIQRRKEERNNR